MKFQKHTRDERNKTRSEALTRIKQLDDMEDIRMLEEEPCELRRCGGVVVEENHKREMDVRQQSRQLWL